MKFTSAALAALTMVLGSALAPGGAATAQVAPAAAVAPQAGYDLQADVLRVLKDFEVPGMAIAVVKDGKVVTTRGFGVRKLGEDAAVDENTLFEIASNSKGFTAALLAMLVDEGKLAWDDPVLKHLPDFQMYDPYVTREMTVRDLLVHRSGLGLGAGDLMWWPTTTLTADEIIHRLRYIRPATSFRSAYAYDNLLYIVATRIIAQKTGKSWGQVTRERIFAPLGMRHSTTSLVENQGNPNVASAHSRLREKSGETLQVVRQLPVQNAAGAVGINSSAADIARWMKVLLDGGQVEGGARLWSAAQAREMWTGQTPMPIREPHPLLSATRPNFLAYGLGFQVRDYRGMKLVQHGGALQGFYSRVLMVPQARLGIAIFTNAENDWAIAALQYRLLDQYLGAAPVDWIGRVQQASKEAHDKALASVTKAAAARAAHSRPSLPLAGYEGQYQDPWYGIATIGRQGSRQVLSFSNTPDLTGVLEHFQYDTFIVRWKERNFNADAYVTFSLNPDGSIERMRMAPVSSETDFSYDFQDLMFTPVRGKR